MNSMRVLTLQVPAERVDDVIAYYLRERILETANASSAQLVVDDNDPGTIIVLACWRDPAAYAAWQSAPEREVFTRGIADITGGQVRAASRELRIIADTSRSS